MIARHAETTASMTSERSDSVRKQLPKQTKSTAAWQIMDLVWLNIHYIVVVSINIGSTCNRDVSGFNLTTAEDYP